MKKKLLSLALLCGSALLANAQQQYKPFDYLDLGVNVGATGLGIDLATHVSDNFRVRAGFSFMPKVDVKMNFGIEGRKKDENGNWVPTKFDSMASKFQDFTGLEINDNVDMLGTPNFYNGNLLVDYFPIKNNSFHVTAGFYIGPSKVASACNTIEEMPSLIGVTMYNRIYEKVENFEPIIGDDIYLTPELEEKILENGRLGIHVGDRVDTGEPFMMEPDENSTVKADMFVNVFKPYLGVGYGCNLSENNIRFEVDGGVMFWGGTPQILTKNPAYTTTNNSDTSTKEKEYIDLAKDVKNIGGKVGRYVGYAKSLKVYPVINLRISFRLY